MATAAVARIGRVGNGGGGGGWKQRRQLPMPPERRPPPPGGQDPPLLNCRDDGERLGDGGGGESADRNKVDARDQRLRIVHWVEGAEG